MIGSTEYGRNRTDPSARAKWAPPMWTDQKWKASQTLSILPGTKCYGPAGQFAAPGSLLSLKPRTPTIVSTVPMDPAAYHHPYQ